MIKVQRPGIIPRCMADMKIMRFMAKQLARFKTDAELANPVGVIDDFTNTLTEELDFRKEAANLDKFNDIMRELGHKNIRAPVPHHEYTTRKVLVMEQFVGLRVDKFDEIKAKGIDGEGKLVDGLRAWFQCVVFYGFFHGDVHAGNLMLLDDDTIGFLDFGIVGRFDDKARYLVTDYMIAFASGNYKRLAEIIVEMAGAPDEARHGRLRRPISARRTARCSRCRSAEVNYADFLPGIQRTATRHRMRMPNEFILITKQLLYFDRYAKALAPKLNVFTDPRLVLGMMQRHPEGARAGRSGEEGRVDLAKRSSTDDVARPLLGALTRRGTCRKIVRYSTLLGVERAEHDADLMRRRRPSSTTRRAPGTRSGSDCTSFSNTSTMLTSSSVPTAIGSSTVAAQSAARDVLRATLDRRRADVKRHRGLVGVARMFAARGCGHCVPKAWLADRHRWQVSMGLRSARGGGCPVFGRAAARAGFSGNQPSVRHRCERQPSSASRSAASCGRAALCRRATA